MKKVIFALCAAIALLMTSCYEELGTAQIKYAIVDENGEVIDNMLGFTQVVFSSMQETFKAAGYESVSNTFSGGEFFSKEPMSPAQAKRDATTLSKKAIDNAKASVIEKYPYASPRTFTFRVEYKIATQEVYSKFDTEIPADYSTESYDK